MGSGTIEAIRSKIATTLEAGGIAQVTISNETDAAGNPEAGAFAITSELGALKLYLPRDLLAIYPDDPTARQKIDDSLSGLVRLLKRP